MHDDSGADVSKRPSIRRAQPSDNEAMCALFRSVTMDTDLHLAVERDPNFFALYDLQDVDVHPLVATIGDAVEGVATFLARPAFIGGEKLRIGYAGDLRFSPKIRGMFMSRNYGRVFADACSTLGFELALTAVIHSNQGAMRALVARNSRYPEKPSYRLLRAFQILNVQFTMPRRPRRSAYHVRQATLDDLPAIAALLAADHATRPFGYVFDAEILMGRLRLWPGLAIESFYLAFAGERLVGVVAPWDARAVKRFRVLAYRGRMRWVRLAANAMARVVGGAGLPPPGGLFNYFYLTHVSIENDDPDILRAIVERVYADYRTRGYHFFTTVVFEDDPLGEAFAGFRTTALPAGLYTLALPGGRYDGMDFGAGRPGFEAALV